MRREMPCQSFRPLSLRHAVGQFVPSGRDALRGHWLAVLKAFFNWCMARSLAASNPVSRVKFFNDDNSRLRYLTEDDYNRLIEAAKTIEASPFLAEKIILSAHTGLRRSSLFHLRWDYVDFLSDERIISSFPARRSELRVTTRLCRLSRQTRRKRSQVGRLVGRRHAESLASLPLP